MTDIAIRVQNLSKYYQIYDKPHDRLKQSLYPRWQRLTGRPAKQYYREFWALKDVSFEIKKGETVSIIGRNGSGKSTLLQLICGTLMPTGGSVKTNGRIAALLELGSGFNPEFTGRENVRMSCALLGLSPGETEARFDDIAAFADIGDFIEQPVKTYSSGMFVRLAFAVNIVSEPDIMIVDEALAVGDMRFQVKCMSALTRRRNNGATLVFVSHDIATVTSLCTHAIYLNDGKLVASGPSPDITQLYQHNMREDIIKDQYLQITTTSRTNTKTSSAQPFDLSDNSDCFKTSKEFDRRVSEFRDGTGDAKVTFVELLDESGNNLTEINFNQTVVIKIHFTCHQDTTISPGYYIKDKYKNSILGAIWTGVIGRTPIQAEAGDRFIATFVTKLPLQDGIYSITTELINPVILDVSVQRLDDLSDAVVFEILPRKNGKCWSRVYLQNTTDIRVINGSCLD
jgi:lipopolysaccharide transport system ATP-binding protein